MKNISSILYESTIRGVKLQTLKKVILYLGGADARTSLAGSSPPMPGHPYPSLPRPMPGHP